MFQQHLNSVPHFANALTHWMIRFWALSLVHRLDVQCGRSAGQVIVAGCQQTTYDVDTLVVAGAAAVGTIRWALVVGNDVLGTIFARNSCCPPSIPDNCGCCSCCPPSIPDNCSCCPPSIPDNRSPRPPHRAWSVRWVPLKLCSVVRLKLCSVAVLP